MQLSLYAVLRDTVAVLRRQEIPFTGGALMTL